MRAVLDCNVVASGLMRREGPPGLILAALYRADFELVLSPAILSEYHRALRYPKVRSRIALSAGELEDFEADLALRNVWVDPAPPSRPLVASDPADDAYLLAAMEGGAARIVSGDRHLKSIGSHEGIPILSPAEFLRSLGPS